MFWLSLIVLSLAVVLVKLGAYSVWVSILTGGLKVALLVITILVVALIWKKFVGAKN